MTEYEKAIATKAVRDAANTLLLISDRYDQDSAQGVMIHGIVDWLREYANYIEDKGE